MSKPYSARVWDGEEITFRISSNGHVFTVKRKLDKHFHCIRGFGVFQGKQQVEPYRILGRETLVNWLDTGELVEVCLDVK